MARNQGKGLIKWDEEMAKQAEIAAGMEASSGGGKFFSLKAGLLSYNNAPLPGNQMAVVILDGILENVHYAGKFEEGNPSSPDCYAFGRDEKAMTPHPNVIEAGTQQAEGCIGCPLNEWGSADTGKGKACRNTRRLAMVSAGTFDQQGRFQAKLDDLTEQEMAFMKLPVTSIKGYAAYVKGLAASHKRPPHGMITKVRVVPDTQTQFKVLFEAIAPIGNENMELVMSLHEQAKAAIEFPYQAYEAPAAPAPRGRATPAPRPMARPSARVATPVAKGKNKF